MSSSLESKVHKYAMTLPKQMVGQADLQSQFPNTALTDIGLAINNLSKKNLVVTMDLGAKGIKWKAVSKSEAKKMASLDDEEGLVYRVIEQAGRDAIWTMHIRSQTNLHQTVVNKVLKALEGRNEIKVVKSIKFPTRKLYMLFHLTPSVEMTGGPWFTDHELDTEFIKQLLGAILSFIKQRSFPKVKNYPSAVFPPSHVSAYPTASQIATWIRKAQISTTELNVGHVRVLLDVLEFDGEIQALPAGGSSGMADTWRRGGGGGRGEGSSSAASDKAKKSKARKAKDSESSDASEDDEAEARRARRRKKAKAQKVEKERRRKAEKEKRRRKEKERRKKRKGSDDGSGDSGSGSESASSDASASSDDDRRSSKLKSKSKRSSFKSRSKKRRAASDSGTSSSDSDSDPSDALEHDSDDSSDDSAARAKKARRAKKAKAAAAASRSRSRSKSRGKGSDDDGDGKSDGSLPSDADSIDRDMAARKEKKAKRVEVSLESSDNKTDRKSSKSKRKGKESESEPEERPDLADFEDEEGDALVYRAVRPEKVDLGWTAAPCGRCPAFDICSPSGPINPDGCTYYSTWLDQNFG